MALGDAGGRSPAMMAMAARREAFARPIGVGAERQRPSSAAVESDAAVSNEA